jgi:hypothetical protein
MWRLGVQRDHFASTDTILSSVDRTWIGNDLVGASPQREYGAKGESRIRCRCGDGHDCMAVRSANLGQARGKSENHNHFN